MPTLRHSDTDPVRLSPTARAILVSDHEAGAHRAPDPDCPLCIRDRSDAGELALEGRSPSVPD